jgi:hypothetical protein
MPNDPALQRPAAPTESPLAFVSLPRFMFIAAAATPEPPVAAGAEAVRREKIQQTAVALEGQVERLALPFGDGMIYMICRLPSNRAAASFAAVMRAEYASGVRAVALPRPRRHVEYLTDES